MIKSTACNDVGGPTGNADGNTSVHGDVLQHAAEADGTALCL